MKESCNVTWKDSGRGSAIVAIAAFLVTALTTGENTNFITSYSGKLSIFAI